MEAPRPAGRARLARYGLWQFRDYLLDRGGPTFIISVLLGYLTVAPRLTGLHVNMAHVTPRMIARYGSVELARAAVMSDFNGSIAGSLFGALVFLGALLGMNGIVANDRKSGYYRFLFSKPVSPSRYYGQAFLLHVAGFLVVVAALDVVYGLALSPLLTGPRLVAIIFVFLCYAGIAFLLSAAARWDWLSLVAVTVAVTYLWDTFGESASPLAKLLYVLPPLHRTDVIYHAAARATPLPWPALLWVAGYGVACFVAGLVVLRYRRLAIA